ncbi:MAG: hypothetical protein O7B99_15975 [Planctomycetota bacterium]|nr:hypothetical protein [Planctomycetota bacterium]
MHTGEIRFPKHATRVPLPPLHTERLYECLGVERDLNETVRTLRHYVQEQRAPVVGAVHVTCSDEAQQECIQAFDRNFVRYMLPSLKFAEKAPFRCSNLGGRYEWGAVPISEDHFADAKGAEDWKLLLVKIDAHVSVEPDPTGPRYGRMQRYDTQSVYCGAIHAVLDGDVRPFSEDLEQAFGFEGVDRLTALNDPQRVDPRLRSLFGAITSARLQARRAMLDVQDHVPRTPTLYLVVPCVTLNRREHDTEIVCGVYTADHRSEEPHHEYCGLGDLPWEYRLTSEAGGIEVSDATRQLPRHARDHRALVGEEWRKRGHRTKADDPRLKEALDTAAREGRHGHDRPHAKLVAKTLLALLVEVSPIPAAVLLFAEGLAHIHHVNMAHRLAREAADAEAAKAMLTEIHDRIDTMPPEQAQHVVELLLREYRD